MEQYLTFQDKARDLTLLWNDTLTLQGKEH